MYYLIELRDSDGNDCSVDDLLIGPVADHDAALDAAMAYVESTWPDDESDGGYGTFHPCDCECEHGSPWDDDAPGHEKGRCGDDGWECSHGGVLVNELPDNAEAFETAAAARASHRFYHGLIDLTTKE